MSNLVGVATRAVSVVTDTVVLGVTFWNTFYILRMDNTVRSTANLTEKLAHNGNIDHHWYVVLLLTDLLYRRDTIRVRCVYLFRGTFVYWEYEYRILLALNILMMVLDILSIAGDGVSTLDGAGYPASDMSIAWQPITIRPSGRCVGITSNLCLVLLTSNHRIAPIILSRFILDLRDITEVQSTSVTSQLTIQFTPGSGGGAGDSSNSAWTSDVDHDEGEASRNGQDLECLTVPCKPISSRN